ncbi:MAG: alpha-2-macroglobulin, partial [Chitinophagales bacterium]
ELKSVLLQETPWVLESKNEEDQHRNLAMLMDMARMHDELQSILNKLEAMQSAGGGFPWFKEGPDDRYITQYILTGIGHLKKLGAIPEDMAIKINQLVRHAMAWVDKKLLDDYEASLKKKNITNEEPSITAIHIQWLYLRTFFPEISIPAANIRAYEFYSSKAVKQWLEQSRFMQGMIAIFLGRKGELKIAKQILASLKENAIYNEEMGMYWKDMQSGYYWYQSPLETVSLLIEAFGEIDQDTKSVNALKTWLLSQKQTQNWGTTRATADACYALLVRGSDWLENNPRLRINLGNMEIPTKTDKNSPGMGYFKESILPPFIKPDMGNIKVTLSPSPGEKKLSPSWGAVYWQYFEDMEKVSASDKKGNPLKISRKIYLKKNTDQGPILQPIAENGYLKTGDRVTVRIEIRSDRDMEYVHLKDLRASCMEPVNVLSGYKWQGGLGYYEAGLDASTSFFFNFLPKGSHVFEYDLYVSAAGTFTNGITTIQCMYAPEFGAHSEGLMINVQQPD